MSFRNCKSAITIRYLIRKKRPNRMTTCFLFRPLVLHDQTQRIEPHLFFPTFFTDSQFTYPTRACREPLCTDFTNSNGLHKVGDREEQSKSFCDSMGNQMQDLMPAKINLVDKMVYFNLATQSNSLHSHTNTCACMSQEGKGCVIALPVLAAALAYFYLNSM